MLIFLPFVIGSSSYYKYYYMDERCGEEINMQDDDIETGTLDLTIFLTYKPSMNCQLTIKAPDDKQIMIYFTEIDMKEKKRRYGNTCEDYLELFDGSTTSNNSVPGSDLKICGDYEPKTAYYTSGQYLTLRFTSDYRRQDRGFVLLFTSFHTGLCNGTEEFQCQQGQCISKSFQNDGYSQCGDYSDELITNTDMDYYAVGAVVVIICIIVATCYICKRHKQRGAVIKRSGNQSEIPLTSQPVSQPFHGQQPGYQQPPAVYQHQPASYPQQQPGYHPQSGYPPQPVYTDHIGHPQPGYVPLPGNPQPGYVPLPEKLPQPSYQPPPGYPSQPNYHPGYHLVDPPPYTESPYPSAPPKQ
ncbi:uncharacterized protein LOC127700807 [Mytilus californianus]|uniref:uncharacterized protein LOC127700807 n=1 Tax=Mytilus californianus TaxID=6549 RepID=UPI002246B9BF|nr:uncharacterized protein LOC127700807 [Mytilus californianus]